MTIDEIVGRNFKRFRKKLGLSQMEVGKHLGLHQAAVCRVEKGLQALTPFELCTAAALFRCRVSSLVKGALNETG